MFSLKHTLTETTFHNDLLLNQEQSFEKDHGRIISSYFESEYHSEMYLYSKYSLQNIYI